jgi:hypothetical protein
MCYQGANFLWTDARYGRKTEKIVNVDHVQKNDGSNDSHCLVTPNDDDSIYYAVKKKNESVIIKKQGR